MAHFSLYILLGLVAGVVSVSLGVGAGLVMVPALALLFAVPWKSAQGIALAVMVPMALIGALRYIHNPEIRVDMTVVGWVALGAVVGALFGFYIPSALPVIWLKRIFAVFLIIVAANILWRSRSASPPAAPPTTQQEVVHHEDSTQ